MHNYFSPDSSEKFERYLGITDMYEYENAQHRSLKNIILNQQKKELKCSFFLFINLSDFRNRPRFPLFLFLLIFFPSFA